MNQPNLEEVLTPAFEKTMRQYHDYLNQGVSLDAKDFTAFHNGCKAVLSHMNILMKLMQGKNEPEPEQDDLLSLIEKAKQLPIEREEIYVEFD